MANLSVEIAVYADWDGLPAPLRLGFLYARRGAAREIFEFAFDRPVLDHLDLMMAAAIFEPKTLKLIATP